PPRISFGHAVSQPGFLDPLSCWTQSPAPPRALDCMTLNSLIDWLIRTKETSFEFPRVARRGAADRRAQFPRSPKAGRFRGERPNRVWDCLEKAQRPLCFFCCLLRALRSSFFLARSASRSRCGPVLAPWAYLRLYS